MTKMSNYSGGFAAHELVDWHDNYVTHQTGKAFFRIHSESRTPDRSKIGPHTFRHTGLVLNAGVKATLLAAVQKYAQNIKPGRFMIDLATGEFVTAEGVPTHGSPWHPSKPGYKTIKDKFARLMGYSMDAMEERPPAAGSTQKNVVPPPDAALLAEADEIAKTMADARVVRDDFSKIASSNRGELFFDRFGAAQSADLVREARRVAGLTQTQLAEKLGVKQSRVAELERGEGKHGPTIGILERVAHACGRTLSLTLK